RLEGAIRMRSGRFRPDDANRRALGVGAHDAERAGGDADVDAAGDHRLHGLAAAAGEQQFEVEVVLAENAGALAQRGRTPCHFSRCPTAILSLSAAKAGMVASHPAMAAARQIPALWITAALIAVAPSAPWENLSPRR